MKEQPHLTVNGFMLIDAPHSALNMLGQVEGAATENQVAIKNIQRGGRDYPYVSAQALRYWWRNALETECGWEMSPIEREKKIAFTQAKPWQYADDDVFGYMRAQAEWVADVDRKTGEPKRDPNGDPILKKGKNATLTRNSPLKCSPLVSVTAQRPTRDFGTMSRQDGNPVPYERQFYSSVLKGMFSLDLTVLGRFQRSNRTGFQNISEEGLTLAEEYGALVTGELAAISLEERRQRARDTVSVLPYLSGGANQTLHLTDVTPKLVVLTVLRGGNHLFMNIAREERRGTARINVEALKEVLKAYRDRLQTDVFIGRRSGFLDEQADEISTLSDAGGEYPTIHVGEVNGMIMGFADQMTACIE